MYKRLTYYLGAMSEVMQTIGFDEMLAGAEKALQENPRDGFTQTLALLEQAETSADDAAINKAKELMSRCYQANGNYHKALQVCLEALPYFESIENYEWAAKCLNNLGAAYNYLGEYENRLQTNLQCLAYRRKGGDEAGEISTLSNIGDTYNALGNHEKALEYFNLCLQFDSITPRTRTIVIHNIGETEFFKGNFERAREYFTEAVDLAKATSYYIIEEVAFVFLAKIHFQDCNFNEAIACLDSAEIIVLERNYKAELPPITNLRAQISEKQNRHEDAARLYRAYIEQTEAIRKENDTRAMQDMQFAYRVEKLEEENRAQKEKNRALRQAYLKIAMQHRVIEEKNRSITDSINYAFKIQSALLPSEWRYKKSFSDSFIFNRPRDIVSGDFYWLHESDSTITLAVADCTGHGVPGALMSIVGIDCLNLVINDALPKDPASLMHRLDGKVISALNMESANDASTDGMDISIMQKDKTSGIITISSANRPVFHVHNSQLEVIKPDKFPIGAYFGNEKRFTNHQITTNPGDLLYLFTDGYTDQFGGARGKKLKLKGFRDFIHSLSGQSIGKQEIAMGSFFDEWKGNHDQLDDVLVIGIRL